MTGRGVRRRLTITPPAPGNRGNVRAHIMLEPEFWIAFDEMCDAEGYDDGAVVRMTDTLRRKIGGSRASALRVMIMSYWRREALKYRPGGRIAAPT